MNFFRKTDITYISLQAQDLRLGTSKLWSDLQYSLAGEKLKHVTLRLNDCEDITMRALSIIISLAMKLKDLEVRFEFEAPKRILILIKRMNFAAYFSELREIV